MTCFQMTIKCMFVFATANKSIPSFLFFFCYFVVEVFLSFFTFFIFLSLRSVIVLLKLPDLCCYIDKCEISLISRM